MTADSKKSNSNSNSSSKPKPTEAELKWLSQVIENNTFESGVDKDGGQYMMFGVDNPEAAQRIAEICKKMGEPSRVTLPGKTKAKAKANVSKSDVKWLTELIHSDACERIPTEYGQRIEFKTDNPEILKRVAEIGIKMGAPKGIAPISRKRWERPLTKICTNCNQDKHLSEFGSHPEQELFELILNPDLSDWLYDYLKTQCKVSDRMPQDMQDEMKILVPIPSKLERGPPLVLNWEELDYVHFYLGCIHDVLSRLEPNYITYGVRAQGERGRDLATDLKYIVSLREILSKKAYESRDDECTDCLNKRKQ